MLKNKELITWVWARTGSMRRKALFQRTDTQKPCQNRRINVTADHTETFRLENSCTMYPG